MPPSHCSWQWRQALFQGREASPGSTLGHCPVLRGLSWHLCAVAEGAGVGWAPGRTLPSMLYAWPRESPSITSELRLGCRFKGKSSTSRGEYDEGTRARGGDGCRCDPRVCKTLDQGIRLLGPPAAPQSRAGRAWCCSKTSPVQRNGDLLYTWAKGGSEISKWENGIEKIMSRSSRQACFSLCGGRNGAGTRLLDVHDQGCHVVRVLDAEGHDGGAGLGQCHLTEDRL